MADQTFEDIMASVNAAMDADPASAKISAEIRRKTIAKALRKYGRSDAIQHDWKDDDGLPWPDEPEPEVDERPAPRELRVPNTPAEEYWWDKPEDAEFIEHYILSRVALGSRLPGGLLITGPAGSGKTKSVVHAVERINAKYPELGLPLLVMNCPTITDEQKWFGRREVDETGTHYVKSDFVSVTESGGVVLLDEFMRLHPRIHNPVMSLLDGTESVLLSDLNLTITRNPRTIFIGTTNQGAQYGGTHRMDWAMRERWSFTIEREFPETDEEVAILTAHNPDCDADAARVLVDIAQKTRQMFETGDLRSQISTRTLDNAAFLVASGYNEAEALRRTALSEFDSGAEGVVGQESERARVMAIIQGRAG